jgi:hypothetical protein
VAQVAECLSTKCKALSPNTDPPPKKKIRMALIRTPSTWNAEDNKALFQNLE